METQTNVTRRDENRPERVPQRRVAVPPVDIFENTNELLLVADVPGVTEDAINVRVEKNQLQIEAAYKPEERNAEALRLQPFSYVRNFLLPGGIDPERITAELRQGVLQVHLPKRESLKPRQIAVKAG